MLMWLLFHRGERPHKLVHVLLQIFVLPYDADTDLEI